jgi:hypothetical protein
LFLTFQPLIAFFNGTSFHVNVGSVFCFTSMTLLRNFFVCQFVLASMSIQSRFKVLNENLEKLLMRKRFQKNGLSSELGRVFSGLCDSIEDLNRTFTMPFVFLFPNLLLYSIFTSYGIVNELLEKVTLDVANVCLNSILVIAYNSVITVTCWQGAKLTSTADTTLSTVSQMMSKLTQDKDQKVDLVYLSMQMRMRNLKVQNFLFNINWSTLLTVSS